MSHRPAAHPPASAAHRSFSLAVAGSGGAGSVLRIRLGGKFTPGVIAILVLYAVTYILLLLPGVGNFLAQTMLLRPAQALGTRPYQLLTAPLFMTSILALGFVALLDHRQRIDRAGTATGKDQDRTGHAAFRRTLGRI